MRIETLDRSYPVVRVMDSGADSARCHCRHLLEGEWRDVDVVCVRNPDHVRRLLPLAMDLKRRSSFTDCIDSFSLAGELYLVFLHAEGPSLDAQLQVHPWSTDERLTILRSLLARITLLDMPAPILNDVLKSENLLCDDALRISFRYALSGFSTYDRTGFDAAQQSLARLMARMLEKEPAAARCPEWKAFLSLLEQGGCPDALDVLRRFDRAREAVLSTIILEDTAPKGFFGRLKAWFARCLSKAGAFASLLLVVSALLLLIYSIMAAKPATGPSATQIGQIGTVTIETTAATQAPSGGGS